MKMLRKYCPWFRRTSKRRGNVSAESSADMKNTPPPYYPVPRPNLDPMPRTDTYQITVSPPIAGHDAIIRAAAAACILSTAAITARALAESPESAIAMANALQRIRNTVTTVFTARGIPPDSPTAASIWNGVLLSAIDKAHQVAERLDEPDLASREAARLERKSASGGADADAIRKCKRTGIAIAT